MFLVLGLGRSHQLPDGIKDNPELSVVFLFQCFGKFKRGEKGREPFLGS
jgi:hypothetical protein